MKERKFLAHYVDAAFKQLTSEDGTPPTGTNYVRLGKHLEQYNIELNPQVNQTNNILGEQVATHTGYQVSSTVETYYSEQGDPLFEKLTEIVNNRATGTHVESTVVDVLLNEDGTVEWAYMESCLIIPSSMGGDTSGIQIPFQIYNNGNRHRVNFNVSTKTATKYTA